MFLSALVFLVASPQAKPVFTDGQAQVVEAFNDPKLWIKERLWVETNFDSDKDGAVSVAEFRAPTLTIFDKMDTNKDGTLSPAEQQAAPSR